jgi:succinate-acetate transporter protein
VIKASGYVGIITAFIAYYTVAEVLYKANGVMALYVRQRWCLADPRTPSS